MLIGIIIAIAIVIIDQISKAIVMNNMSLNQVIQVIPNLLKFRYVENTGMAFSALSDSTPLLVVISLVATFAIGYILYKFVDFKNKKVLSLSLAFMLGGTIGNLIDRFLTVIGVRNGVIDFIELYIGDINIIGGSTFNIADAFLVVGCVLLVIDLLILDTVRKNKKDDEAVEPVKLEENSDGQEDNSRQ